MTLSVNRPCDVVKNYSELEEVTNIPIVPISMGFTANDETADIFVDQLWSKGRLSGVYQLSSCVELDLLYAEQYDTGVIGYIWKHHHERLASFIASAR